MAGIFDYIAGEFIRKATADEYRRYLKEIAHLPPSERAVGAVDGTPYGLPERIIWMEE